MRRLLIANRGEIALRVIQAARNLGIESVAIYTDADSRSLHVLQADHALRIGPPSATLSYLNQSAIVHAAKTTACDAIHPGYGFLAENSAFARLCETENINFVGPRSETIQDMGDKVQARMVANTNDIDVVPGSADPYTDPELAKKQADSIGYPVLIKARGGGGGRGMRVVTDPASFFSEFIQATAEAESAFGDPEIYLERFLSRIRHIEVQILADFSGEVIALGERDCTVQRRHQKLVEEAPCVAISQSTRKKLHECAVQLGKSIAYRGAGTVEFVLTEDLQQFFFIEMNTRIQVEHPVTECLVGFELIEAQLRIARGEKLSDFLSLRPQSGHAIEFRINAESWQRGFAPCPGRIESWSLPAGSGIRVDTHCYENFRISPYYDSMIAKLIVHGHSRAHALQISESALRDFQIQGIDSTIGFHQRLLENPSFKSGDVYTTWVEQEFMKET